METAPLQSIAHAGVVLRDHEPAIDIQPLDSERTAQERLAFLLEAAHIIPWEADFRQSKFTFVGKPAEEALGYPTADWHTSDFWPSHLHPEDRERAIAEAEKLAWSCDTFELEYRMIAKDGRPVWLYSLVTVQRENGEPAYLCGFSINVSRLRQAPPDSR
jgi:PAS domain S-box-containing protein